MDTRVDVPYAAQRLGMSVHQVYRRIHRGDLLAVLVGNRYLIELEDLGKYIREGMPFSRPVQFDLDFMSVSEAAQLLKISSDHVRRLCHEGVFRIARRDSRNSRLRIYGSDVIAYRVKRDNLIASGRRLRRARA